MELGLQESCKKETIYKRHLQIKTITDRQCAKCKVRPKFDKVIIQQGALTLYGKQRLTTLHCL